MKMYVDFIDKAICEAIEWLFAKTNFPESLFVQQSVKIKTKKMPALCDKECDFNDF